MEKKIVLRRGKEEALLRRHPWIFSGAIQHKEGSLVPGDIVAIHSAEGNKLGYGMYEEGSLQVRMVTFSNEEPTEAFWYRKLEKAFQLRKDLNLVRNPLTNAYRSINAEGDGFPGLVADYYNGVIVLQAQTPGMQRLLKLLSSLLQKLYDQQLVAIYSKPAEYAVRYDASLLEYKGFLMGKSDSVEILENGARFHVNIEDGQKTGFFLDQRDNRYLVSQYARGRKVLNAFSYTGGFSIYALMGGASMVHSVDSARRAIEGCKQNLLLNGFDVDRNVCIEEDVLRYLNRIDNDYDLLILDPPAFAKHVNQRAKALKAYRYINRLAIANARPGSFLFTFSCSQVVNIEMFRSMILSAAIEVGRQVKVLHLLRQPPDHPVDIYLPEGEYLKGLVLYIE